MHLLTEGSVQFNGPKKVGKLLLTDRSVFLLQLNNDGALYGGVLGGLLGALIGHWVDKQKAKQTQPAHLNDPEIAALDEKVRRELLGTELLVKLPLDSNLSVKATTTGFFFQAGALAAKYGGFPHRKKISSFLAEHGVRIASA